MPTALLLLSLISSNPQDLPARIDCDSIVIEHIFYKNKHTGTFEYECSELLAVRYDVKAGRELMVAYDSTGFPGYPVCTTVRRGGKIVATLVTYHGLVEIRAARLEERMVNVHGQRIDWEGESCMAVKDFARKSIPIPKGGLPLEDPDTTFTR